MTQGLTSGSVFRIKAEPLPWLVCWGSTNIASSSVLAKEYGILLSTWTLGACVLHPNSDSAIFWWHDLVQVSYPPCILISSSENEFTSHKVLVRIKVVNTFRVPHIISHYFKVDYCYIINHLWSHLVRTHCLDPQGIIRRQELLSSVQTILQYRPSLCYPSSCFSLSSFSFLPSLPSTLLSSIFLGMQVRSNNELDIDLFHFMDSVIDICAYLSTWLYNSGEL